MLFFVVYLFLSVHLFILGVLNVCFISCLFCLCVIQLFVSNFVWSSFLLYVVCLSVCLCVYLCWHLFMSPCRWFCLPVRVCVCVCVCFSVCLSVCLFVSVCLYWRLFMSDCRWFCVYIKVKPLILRHPEQVLARPVSLMRRFQTEQFWALLRVEENPQGKTTRHWLWRVKDSVSFYFSVVLSISLSFWDHDVTVCYQGNRSVKVMVTSCQGSEWPETPTTERWRSSRIWSRLRWHWALWWYSWCPTPVSSVTVGTSRRALSFKEILVEPYERVLVEFSSFEEFFFWNCQ